jgi:hypothetical protein
MVASMRDTDTGAVHHGEVKAVNILNVFADATSPARFGRSFHAIRPIVDVRCTSRTIRNVVAVVAVVAVISVVSLERVAVKT